MSTSNFVEYQEEGAVALIRLNRPEKLNAFNRQLYRQVNHAVRRFITDADSRVAVIRASGRSFSSGVDLEDLRAAISELGDKNLQGVTHQFAIDFEEDEFVDKPILAAIQGHCYGQGMSLALACDLRIATEDAMFCLPEVKLGVASVSGTLRCVQNAGLGNALELLLMGEPRDAQWAYRAGLVNLVVKPDELDARAMEWASAIAAIDPEAIRATRKLAVFAQFNKFEDTIHLGSTMRQRTRLDYDYVASITGSNDSCMSPE